MDNIGNLKILMQRQSTRSIIVSILLIIFAIILIINPIQLINNILIAMGILIILDGVWHIFSYSREPQEFRVFSIELIQGIIEIILGIIFIINHDWVIPLIYIFIGGYIILESIMKIQMALNLKDVIFDWKIVIIISVLSILFGCYIIGHPFLATEAISLVLGIMILITEAINLIESIVFKIKINKI